VRDNGFIESVFQTRPYPKSGTAMTVVRPETRSIAEMVDAIICDVCLELFCDVS
jgi:hypothetical protein